MSWQRLLLSFYFGYPGGLPAYSRCWSEAANCDNIPCRLVHVRVTRERLSREVARQRARRAGDLCKFLPHPDVAVIGVDINFHQEQFDSHSRLQKCRARVLRSPESISSHGWSSRQPLCCLCCFPLTALQGNGTNACQNYPSRPMKAMSMPFAGSVFHNLLQGLT